MDPFSDKIFSDKMSSDKMSSDKISSCRWGKHSSYPFLGLEILSDSGLAHLIRFLFRNLIRTHLIRFCALRRPMWEILSEFVPIGVAIGSSIVVGSLAIDLSDASLHYYVGMQHGSSVGFGIMMLGSWVYGSGFGFSGLGFRGLGFRGLGV